MKIKSEDFANYVRKKLIEGIEKHLADFIENSVYNEVCDEREFEEDDKDSVAVMISAVSAIITTTILTADFTNEQLQEIRTEYDMQWKEIMGCHYEED